MWKTLSILFTLTLCVCGWLAYEVGALGGKRIEASEKQDLQNEGLQKEMSDRNKKLDEREAELKKREKSLEEKERILAQSVGQYEKVIRELRARVEEADSAIDKRAESMRQIYEKMDPKKASKILDEIDVALAAAILGGMRNERAADILGRMSQEKARLVTEKYVGKQSREISKVNERSTAKDQGELVPLKGGEQ